MRSKVASLLAVAFSLGVVQAASASDMPTKAQYYKTPVAESPNWDGYYAGLNIGYGSGHNPFSMSTVSGAGYPGGLPVGTPLYTNYAAPDSINAKGWNGGLQIGFNRQFAPMWLTGIEADFQGSGIKGTENCLHPCGTLLVIVNAPLPTNTARVTFSDISASNKIKWFGTLRGRVGYTGLTGALLYLTGGLAYGEVQRSGSVSGTSTTTGGGFTYNTFSGSYDSNSVKFGWTLGAGVEAKLRGNWSLKAEYLYVDLGKVSDTFSTYFRTSNCGGCGTVGAQAGVRTDTSSIHENIVRVGLNYKFGG